MNSSSIDSRSIQCSCSVCLEATGPAVAELLSHTASDAYGRTALGGVVQKNGRRDVVKRLLEPRGLGAARQRVAWAHGQVVCRSRSAPEAP